MSASSFPAVRRHHRNLEGRRGTAWIGLLEGKGRSHLHCNVLLKYLHRQHSEHNPQKLASNSSSRHTDEKQKQKKGGPCRGVHGPHTDDVAPQRDARGEGDNAAQQPRRTRNGKTGDRVFYDRSATNRAKKSHLQLSYIRVGTTWAPVHTYIRPRTHPNHSSLSFARNSRGGFESSVGSNSRGWYSLMRLFSSGVGSR